MLRALLLTLLWRGKWSQDSGFSLTVPETVSVQESLCVLLPCTFSDRDDTRYYFWNSLPQLHGHWFKDPADVNRDRPVASSDPAREESEETRGRFRLVEEMERSDCTLEINDARRTDVGRYFFRVERGAFKYSYCLTHSLTEEPEIQISLGRGPDILVAGEWATMTCTAPGRCSGTTPQITWTGPFKDTAKDVSVSPANGARAQSSVLGFMPTRGDDGKRLTCTVTYRPAWGPSTSRDVWLQVSLPGPVVWGADGNASLETQEGESLTLICEADSRPKATLSWAKANESLSSSQGGDRELKLSNLSRGDAGEYSCWAKNPYGSASRALHVHVQCKAQGGRAEGTRLGSGSLVGAGPQELVEANGGTKLPGAGWGIIVEPWAPGNGDGPWGGAGCRLWDQ
uniref:Ig-like domain-containing protein n=1 Tax=Pelusios castaneus TaxID=367368 RepID=A0A8C8RJ58_9SAUR